MPGWWLPLAHGGRLRVGRPLVMAILNATPDSFSDGGKLATQAAIKARIEQAALEGADILDVGGESTRPGHVRIAAEDEIARVVPVIEACRRIASEIPISIDTSKAAVARAAIAAGANLINDVSGLADPQMADVVRDQWCAIVLMRSEPLVGSPVEACRQQLGALLSRADLAGIPREATLLDPGIGFGDPPGSDVDANLALVCGVRDYAHGRPVLVGASRKRFIGTITGEQVPERRVAGSVDVAVQAVKAGAAIVRVHDVKQTVTALRGLALVA